MIRRDVILIGLSPTCLRVALTSGQGVVKIDCSPLSPGDWEKAWEQGLTALDAPLAEAVKRLGVKAGAEARISYCAPRAAAEVFNVPADGKTAMQAAELSFRETLPQDTAWPMRLQRLHRDALDSASKEPARSHVLGIADSPVDMDAVAAWLRRAGLRVAGMVPTKAATLALAVRAAASLPAAGAHCVLWIDDHVTVLAGWSGGKLAFARSVDFGYWMLADAIVRGSKQAQPPSRAQAYDALFKAGIPGRQHNAEPELARLTEGSLPLMQPVIQRYVVETRQTLRFSITEAELNRTTIRLAGPGAAIPGLAPMLESMFDITVERFTAPALGGLGNFSRQECGEIGNLIELATNDLDLLAPVEANRLMSRRLDTALRLGAVAAGLSLAAAAGWTLANTSKTSGQAKLLESRIEAMSDHELLRARADKLALDVGGASQTIRQTLGERPRWLAALSLISRACGERVDLAHIAGSYATEQQGGAPMLTLNGTAWPSKDPNVKTDSLAEFLDRLLKSPIVATAKIVSTHAESGGDAKTFVVSVQLKAMSADLVIENLAHPAAPGQGTTAQAQEPTP